MVEQLGSKALSVRQPFAGLLVGRGGVPRPKRVETRSWATNRRGWLMIHAGGDVDREAMADPMVAQIVRESGCPTEARGALVGAVYVVDCAPCKMYVDLDGDMELVRADERLVGDWGWGRFAWLTVGAIRFVNPIPCKGRLGFFDVTVPLAAEIEVVEMPTADLVRVFRDAHAAAGRSA